ncbi:B-box domain protein 30 [Glycine soja]|uniref:B box-type domain-containing protein n=1 Tax=Glycine soja TaxID=3848 RepID=A0A445GQA0_GLYSO|nr:hypothetical protein D0Y65_040155 [Glycine soja]
MLKYSVDDASCFAIQHQQSHWHGFSPQELKWWFCLSALTTTQAGTTHAPEVEASTIPAKLFCESDQASLCWECDAKVHSANFLVTKHPRILLCHVCQSLTAWHGTGPKFVPTMSVCNTCVNNNSETCSQQNHVEDHDDNHDDGTGEDHVENHDGGVSEDDEENQVVPWTSTPPPPASTSSNSVTTSSTRFSNVEEGGSD